MNARKRERRRLIEAFEDNGNWDDRGAAPISDANRWLITGPDSMSKRARRDLCRLLDFHRFARQGTLKPEHTRAFWLAIPDMRYFADYWMKQTYHINLITQVARQDHPFLRLIAR
jgi:hypothetical protein